MAQSFGLSAGVLRWSEMGLSRCNNQAYGKNRCGAVFFLPAIVNSTRSIGSSVNLRERAAFRKLLTSRNEKGKNSTRGSSWRTFWSADVCR